MLVSPQSGGGANGHEFTNEREILYKLFFDMKKDVTELKKMFVEILQNPGAAAAQNQALINELKNKEALSNTGLIPTPSPTAVQGSMQPVMIHHDDDIHHHEEVEESLNIMDKEKELIIKALEKT